MRPNLLIGYAADFVGFLIAKLTPKELGLIREIVLFGSAARGEAVAESDVDLFIDTAARETIERRAETACEEFEKSVKVRDYWRLLGVRQPISLKVGDAASWTALSDALREDGRVLFGRYRSGGPDSGAPKVLLSWENIRSGKARTNLYRNIFGHVARGKRYEGLLERHHGERVTKGAILLPLEALREFQELFRKLGVTCHIRPFLDTTGESLKETSHRVSQPPAPPAKTRPFGKPRANRASTSRRPVKVATKGRSKAAVLR